MEFIREMTGSFSGAEGEVEYRIHVEPTSPGHPGRGPSLSSPGDPPEPPEWEVTLVEQAFYLPDQTEPTWIDVAKLGLGSEALRHIYSWAEGLDFSDEVAEDYQDQAAAAAEHRWELRNGR